MIEIKDITKNYGSLQVLRGVNLRIGKGEVISIVGPSGAGKTTLDISEITSGYLGVYVYTSGSNTTGYSTSVKKIWVTK